MYFSKLSPPLRRSPVRCGHGRGGISRRGVLSAGLALGFAGPARAAAGWDDILRDARGQEVFFHAWGGDERTNAFIAWAGGRLRALYRIELRHVKLRDTSEAVVRIAAEKAAGGTEKGGAADMVWVGGSNLAAMRENGLLSGPVLDLLPATRLIAREDKPATVRDRMVPLDGCAVPWRLMQVVFIHDSRTNPDPPRTIPALLDWAQRHPGRLTHLDVRNSIGAMFLEQALYELVADPSSLLNPVTVDGFAAAAAPLWDWYDRLRPALWQGGKRFPASLAVQRALMNEGQIDLMMSLNPSEAAMSVAAGTLPVGARAYMLEHGGVGNCSFVAVPFNAAHRPGALVAANFLLSPEAQARASDPRFTGVPTVLAMDRLSAEDYVFFDAVPRWPNLLSDAERGVPLPEPHVSWVTQMIAGWERRYAG
jgi:putative thiamine transport system substrate-binding protein